MFYFKSETKDNVHYNHFVISKHVTAYQHVYVITIIHDITSFLRLKLALKMHRTDNCTNDIGNKYY